jgi:hypothetical protein
MDSIDAAPSRARASLLQYGRAYREPSSSDCTSVQDRTINPDLERFMAERMGAKPIEIEASHIALISHPDKIMNLILEALAV